jgi:hypothetical protein
MARVGLRRGLRLPAVVVALGLLLAQGRGRAAPRTRALRATD